MIKNPNWQQVNQLAIYKRVEDLNSGLPRTNPASSQGRARSSAPTARPLCLLSCRKEGMTLNIRKKTAMDQTQDLTYQPQKSIKKYMMTLVSVIPPAISLRVLSKNQNWVARPVILKMNHQSLLKFLLKPITAMYTIQE